MLNEEDPKSSSGATAPTALEQRVDVDHQAHSSATTTTRVPAITDSAFELLSFSSDTQRPQLPANGREPRQNSHNYSVDSGGEGPEGDTPLPMAFLPAGAKLRTPADSSVGSSGSSQDGMIVRILNHEGHLSSPSQAELDVSGNASYGGLSIERSQLLAGSHHQQSRIEGSGGRSSNILQSTSTGGGGGGDAHTGSHQKGGTFLEASSSNNHPGSFHAEDSLHASYGGSIISQSQILPPLPQGPATHDAATDGDGDVTSSALMRRENSQLKLLGLTKQTRKGVRGPKAVPGQGDVRTTGEKLENVETIETRQETKLAGGGGNQQHKSTKKKTVDGELTTMQQAEDWSVSRSRDEDEVAVAGATALATNIAGGNHQEPVGQDVGSSILSGAATKDILSTESVTSSMSKEVSDAQRVVVSSPLTGASLTGVLTQVEATEPTQIGHEVVYVTGENLMGVRSRLIENDECIEGGDNRFTQQRREPCSIATSTAGGNSPPTRSLTQQPAASGSKHTNITYDGPIPDASSSHPNESLLGAVNDDERDSDGDLLSFDLDSPIVSSKKDLKDVVTKHETASSDGSPIHKYTVETPPIFNATGGGVKNGIAGGPVSEPHEEAENEPASKKVALEPEVETEHSTTAPTATNTTASPTPAPDEPLTINVVSGAATEAYSSPLHPISDSDRLGAPIQLESHRSTTSSEAESNMLRASGRHRRATATPTDSLPSWTAKAEVETTKTSENGGMLDTLLQVEAITNDEVPKPKIVSEPAVPNQQLATTPILPPSILKNKIQTKIDAAKTYEKIAKKVNRVTKTSIDVRVYAFATAPSSVGGSATAETAGSRVICVDATLRLCRKGGLIVFEQHLDIDAMLERMEFPVVRYPSGETLGGFKAADVMFCSSDLESSSVGIVLENRKNKVLMARLRQKHLQQVQQQAALLNGSTSSGRPPRSPIKSTTAEQNFPSSSVPPSLALSTSSSFLRSTTTATLASSTNEQQLLSSPTDATNLPTYDPKHTVSMTIRRSLTGGGGTKSSSKNSSKKKKKKSTATLGVPAGGGLRAASLKRSASGTMTNMTGFMSGDEPPIPVHYRQRQQQSLSSNQQQQTADKASLPSSFTAPSSGSGDQGFVGIANNNNGAGNNSPQSAQPLQPFSMSSTSSSSFNESTSSTNSRYKRYAVSDQEEVLELLIETSSVEAAQQLLKEVQALKGM